MAESATHAADVVAALLDEGHAPFPPDTTRVSYLFLGNRFPRPGLSLLNISEYYWTAVRLLADDIAWDLRVPHEAARSMLDSLPAELAPLLDGFDGWQILSLIIAEQLGAPADGEPPLNRTLH